MNHRSVSDLFATLLKLQDARESHRSMMIDASPGGRTCWIVWKSCRSSADCR